MFSQWRLVNFGCLILFVFLHAIKILFLTICFSWKCLFNVNRYFSKNDRIVKVENSLLSCSNPLLRRLCNPAYGRVDFVVGFHVCLHKGRSLMEQVPMLVNNRHGVYWMVVYGSPFTDPSKWIWKPTWTLY